MYNFFSGIGNAISGVYNTVNSWLGVPSAPSQSATALNFNNPVNNQLQAARQNPNIPLPISPGGYTPVPTGGGYASSAQPAPTSYKSGSNLSFSPAPYTAVPSGGGYSTSSYSPSSGVSNFGPPPPAPTVNISSLGGGGGTSTTVMPSSPSGTNYYGASVAGNIATGANPQTGLYQTTPTSTTGTETATPNAQTSEQSRVDKVRQYISDLTGLYQKPASETDAYNRAVQQTGLIQAQQARLNTQNQINGITAQMNSDLLNLRGVAAKEGVTEAVYGGQQAEITREATVRLLPLQAQLAADQGNLELAQSNTNTLFKIYADDAKNSADFYNQNVKAAWDLFTADEKKKADELLWQKNYNADVIKSDSQNQATIANELFKAGDMTGYNAVTSIRPPVNMQSPTFQADYAKYKTDLNSAVSQYGGNIGASDNFTKNLQQIKLQAEIKELNNKANAGGLTQAQANNLGYANRTIEADKVIGDLGSHFTSLASYIPQASIFGISLYPNSFKSDDRQKYEQAQRNFLNSVLRRESGAAISPSEFESGALQYFPQPGDSGAVIKQKSDNRQTTINGLLTASGKQATYNYANTAGQSDIDYVKSLNIH